MKYLLAALVVIAACGDEDKAETPAQAAVKLECKTLLEHVVKISPQMAGATDAAVKARAAALPIEEVQQCTASEPEIRGCMATANDVAAVKKCIPSDEIIGCMQKAAKAADAATAKCKTGEPCPGATAAIAVRAKCWGGDAKAADGLKVEE